MAALLFTALGGCANLKNLPDAELARHAAAELNVAPETIAISKRPYKQSYGNADSRFDRLFFDVLVQGDKSYTCTIVRFWDAWWSPVGVWCFCDVQGDDGETRLSYCPDPQ